MTGGPDDRAYLKHIIECIARIRRYTVGGRLAFLADEMIQDAVVRNLQTLAESTQRLSAALKQRHTSIDWRLIGRFRNVVVHHYLALDVERIWDVVEQQLDPLNHVVSQALAELDSSPMSED